MSTQKKIFRVGDLVRRIGSNYELKTTIGIVINIASASKDVSMKEVVSGTRVRVKWLIKGHDWWASTCEYYILGYDYSMQQIERLERILP